MIVYISVSQIGSYSSVISVTFTCEGENIHMCAYDINPRSHQSGNAVLEEAEAAAMHGIIKPNIK